MRLTTFILIFILTAIKTFATNNNSRDVTEIEVEPGRYPGWIVDTKSDTTYGKVVIGKKDDLTHLQLVVRFACADTVIIYTPESLKAFYFSIGEDTFYFETVENSLGVEVVEDESLIDPQGHPMRAERFFLQKFVDGYYSLFYIRQVRLQGTIKVMTPMANNNFGNEPVPAFTMNRGFVMVDGELQRVKNKKGPTTETDDWFCVKTQTGTLRTIERNTIPDIFASDRELIQAIKEKKYHYWQMPEIVRVFNAWKFQKEEERPQRY